MAIEDTLAKLEQAAADANQANERRYQQAMAIYDEIINRYQPGGSFGKAALGQLEQQKKRDVAAKTQNLISSGLFSSTTTAGLPSLWESQVGSPARLKLEDLQMERLSGAQREKAGFIERREDVGPSYSTIANLAAQVGQGSGGSRGFVSSGGGGSSSRGESLSERWARESAEFRAKKPQSVVDSSYMNNRATAGSALQGSGGTYTGGKDLSSWISSFEDLYGLPAIQTGLEPATGSEGYGTRAAPTIEEPQKGGWLNMVSGKRSKTKPANFNPNSAWVYMSNLKI